MRYLEKGDVIIYERTSGTELPSRGTSIFDDLVTFRRRYVSGCTTLLRLRCPPFPKTWDIFILRMVPYAVVDILKGFTTA